MECSRNLAGLIWGLQHVKMGTLTLVPSLSPHALPGTTASHSGGIKPMWCSLLGSDNQNAEIAFQKSIKSGDLFMGLSTYVHMAVPDTSNLRPKFLACMKIPNTQMRLYENFKYSNVSL